MTLVLFIDVLVVAVLVITGRRRVENALPFFCFITILMPIDARILLPGLFDVSTQRVALLTILALFLITNRRSQVTIPLKGLIAIHLLWSMLSTCYSLSVATSAKLVVAQLIEYYVLFFVFLRSITDVRTVYRIMYAIVLCLGLCCFFGLLEAYATWSIMSILPSNLLLGAPLYIEAGRGLRIRATFPHPILFGDALAMTIPIALYLLSVAKSNRRKTLLSLITVLEFWALYKTGSRGPWLTLGFSSILLWFLVKNRVRKYLTTLAFLVLLVLVARPGIRQTIVDLYESTQDSTSRLGSSYEYRHALIPAVTGALAKDPTRVLVGYGEGTFRAIGLDITFLDITQRWHTCDNNWALFLYETGYVGLLVIAALLFTALFRAVRRFWQMKRPEKDLMGIIVITIAGFYFSLLSVAGYNWGQQGMMLWILISLSVVYPALIAQRRITQFEPRHSQEPCADQELVHLR